MDVPQNYAGCSGGYGVSRESTARHWLEGITDEAGAEIPDDITVGGLQACFDSQMFSNDGKSGFLTRAEAEEALRKACPATDAFLADQRSAFVDEAVAKITESGALTFGDCILALCRLLEGAK